MERKTRLRLGISLRSILLRVPRASEREQAVRLSGCSVDRRSDNRRSTVIPIQE